MPYKDKIKQREFQKLWMRKRRLEYFADKFCVICGSKEKMELDHIDKFTKVEHKIWSWSKERREEELKKCQVLCRVHHEEKGRLENYVFLNKKQKASNLPFGIVYEARMKKTYRVEIIIHRHRFHLGYFKNLEEAVLVREKAVEEAVKNSPFKYLFIQNKIGV